MGSINGRTIGAAVKNGIFQGVPASVETEPRIGKECPAETEIIAMIDGRRLERECFVRSVELLHPRLVVLGFSSAQECTEKADLGPRPTAIIFNIGRAKLSDSDANEELTFLLNSAHAIPVVVLAEAEDLDEMIAALDCGASGYVSVNIGIDGIIEATKLAARGGVFLSVESLTRLRGAMAPATSVPTEFQDLTQRQAAVADALRRGKSNKTIAYELNMCESTVKVHIRTIMRKLKATNRTEAAFRLNSILPTDPAARH